MQNPVGDSPPGDPGTAVGECLAARVPESARTVLQVGSAHGWLARRLKVGAPGRVVYGLDLATPSRHDGVEGLDALFGPDDDPPLERGSVDCIVYADALSRVVDPLELLETHRPLLSPTGSVVCSLANLQHHSVMSQMIRGSFPFGSEEALNGAQVRFFTFATGLQLLLDAGYAPDLVDQVELGGAEAMLAAGAALFELEGVVPRDAERHARILWMIFEGRLLPDVNASAQRQITIVSCVNDEAQLRANLMSSPCLRGPTPHQLLLMRGCATAAEGLNTGIAGAHNDLVVFVHQDVYLPKGWPSRLASQWDLAGRRGSIGVAGVFGVKSRRVPFDAIGHVVHSDHLLSHGELPADVDGLDELLMVVDRRTPLRFDPDLGWHLYGTDIALQAHEAGLRVVVLDALCHHNSLTGRIPSRYRKSERVLARKWKRLLPIHTNISSIGPWLLDAPEVSPLRETDTGAPAWQSSGVEAKLLEDLRAERAALSAELERARLQVASMEASPFWRARQAFAFLRDRLASHK